MEEAPRRGVHDQAVGYGTHAARWQEHSNNKVIVYGPGTIKGQKCHGVNEYVTKRILETSARRAESILRMFCYK